MSQEQDALKKLTTEYQREFGVNLEFDQLATLCEEVRHNRRVEWLIKEVGGRTYKSLLAMEKLADKQWSEQTKGDLTHQLATARELVNSNQLVKAQTQLTDINKILEISFQKGLLDIKEFNDFGAKHAEIDNLLEKAVLKMRAANNRKPAAKKKARKKASKTTS